MKKIEWQKLGLALVLLALLIWGGAYVIRQGKSKESSAQTQETNIISYQGIEGKTAFGLLQEKHKIEFQESDLGVFVTKIDDIENTSDTFWMYYINGQLGGVAADKYVTKAGDRIQWKYEKFSF